MLSKYHFYTILGFIGLVLAANILLLDFFFVKQKSDLIDFQTRLTQLSDSFKILGNRIFTTIPAGGSSSAASDQKQTIPVEQLLALDSCPFTCVSLINSATKSARTTPSILTPVNLPTQTVVTRGEYFIPLGGNISINPGDASGSNWKTMEAAQATFDAGNFGNIKAAYFEIVVRVQSGGEVHGRLFDSTTPLLFFNSELSTSAQSASFLSAPLTLAGGTKVYKVQLYTTQSTGYLDQARIRIVTQ
jgi:hypothetical protein